MSSADSNIHESGADGADGLAPRLQADQSHALSPAMEAVTSPAMEAVTHLTGTAQACGVTETTTPSLATEPHRPTAPAGKTSRDIPAERIEFDTFRRLCGAAQREITQLETLAPGGCDGGEDAAGNLLELEAILDELYDCGLDETDSLKALIVAIQSQVYGAGVSPGLVQFLRETFRYLRARYIIRREHVDEVFEIMEEAGLDRFRGTIAAPENAKKYQIDRRRG